VVATGHTTRIVVAKPGLDGHDRGAKVVARALRDHGAEVIYTGLRQSPEALASAAIEEDVDVLCLSILSGAHVPLCRRLVEALAQQGVTGLPIVVGGTIPDDDVPVLEALGVRAVFGPGSSLEEICSTVSRLTEERHVR
jgi:methylmalonyl-CoA mutase C-terminal domain/subunit